MKTPILNKLMALGHIWKEGSESHGEYVGRAADGTEVTLGIYDTKYPKLDTTYLVEKFLETSPSPESW